jgi:hypothetical protein
MRKLVILATLLALASMASIVHAQTPGAPDSSNPEAALATPIITTFAGNYAKGPGYSGDGGPAVKAQLDFANDLIFDADGNVYITDPYNSVVRKVTPEGIISTVAGNHALGPGYSGDGGAATKAQLYSPAGVVLDAAGNLYISDYDVPVVRKVTPEGIISTVAGNYALGPGYSGDGGPATKAQLANSYGLAVDGKGDLYIADFFNSVVRKVTPSGTISTVAGDGTSGYSGDGGPGIKAQLSNPCGITIDAAGNLYIADLYNAVIRKVTPSGTITTVAGDGTYGYSGDGGPATKAQLAYLEGVYSDAAGNLFISDSYNNVIRKVTASTGIITTVAGDGYGQGDRTGGYTGDGGPATKAELNYPTGAALDAAGNLYFADEADSVIREVHFVSTAAAPVFNPPGGTYYSTEDVDVTITDITAKAVIHYTTDGSIPTTKSPTYGAPIEVIENTTINALAIAAGYDNAYASATYRILPPQAATPTFSPAAGSYGAGQLVAIADATPGSVIYYTTNGSTPSTGTTKYVNGSPVLVEATETLKAFATAKNLSNSNVASAKYTLTGSPSILAIPVTGIGISTATLTAIVNDFGVIGHVWFIYGACPTSLTKTTNPITLAATTAGQRVTTLLTGLTANSTYCVEPVAVTPGGKTYGAVLDFPTK